MARTHPEFCSSVEAGIWILCGKAIWFLNRIVGVSWMQKNKAMNAIHLKLNDAGHGAFVLENEGELLAEMEVGIRDGNLTAYHTEVAEVLKGQGIASKLLAEMVAYARKNNLKVIPLCPYVLAQFRRRPDEYADIWNKRWHSESTRK